MVAALCVTLALGALVFSSRAFAASTLYVNPDGVCGGNSPCHTTIQAAINAAAPGDTIQVAAATYAEQINVNKALTLFGPNANINPNTGVRVAEAVIIPTASDPLNPSFAGPIVVTFSASGVTFRGFTVDGDNPSLTSGVVFNGSDVDAEFGIYGDGSANLDAVVEHNIVKNIGEMGIWLNTFGIGGARNGNSRMNANKVDNLLGAFGQALRISDDAWADVTNNVVTRSRSGIVIENFSGNVTTHPASQIANNTISSFRIGIRHNLHYVYANPGFTITRNNVTAYSQSPMPPQVTTPTAYQGIRVESVQQTVAVDVVDNNVNANRAVLQPAGYTRVEGLNVTNSSATSPNIRFKLNHVTDDIRGVFHETPATPTLTCNNITGNLSGIVIDSASTGGMNANSNNIVGNPTIGVQNNSGTLVNAQSNWWGAANGPGPVGPGSGDKVSTNVDFSNWLTNETNCAPLCSTNVALASYGATAVASSTVNANFPASGVINGEHNGERLGRGRRLERRHAQRLPRQHSGQLQRRPVHQRDRRLHVEEQPEQRLHGRRLHARHQLRHQGLRRAVLERRGVGDGAGRLHHRQHARQAPRQLLHAHPDGQDSRRHQLGERQHLQPRRRDRGVQLLACGRPDADADAHPDADADSFAHALRHQHRDGRQRLHRRRLFDGERELPRVGGHQRRA